MSRTAVRLLSLFALCVLLMPAAAIAAHRRSGRATPPSTVSGVTNPLGAQSATSPFAPGVPFSPSQTQTTTTTPTVTNTNTTSGASGLNGSSVVVIAIGAIVILGGIALFIWRDARRRAPVRSRTAEAVAGAGGRSAGSKRPVKPRKLSPAERRRRKRGRAR